MQTYPEKSWETRAGPLIGLSQLSVVSAYVKPNDWYHSQQVARSASNDGRRHTVWVSD